MSTHVKCGACKHCDTADTLGAGRAGVGWCVARSQYRALQAERRCDDFRLAGGTTTEKGAKHPALRTQADAMLGSNQSAEPV